MAWSVGLLGASGPSQFSGYTITSILTGTNITAQVPEEANSGDLLIAVGLGSITNLSGWTEHLNSASRHISSITWDGVSSSYTFTGTTGAKGLAILCFSQRSWGGVSAVGSSAVDPVAPSLTIGTNNCLLIDIVQTVTDGTTYAGPSGYSLLCSTTTNVSMAIFLYDYPRNLGGAPTPTFTRTSGTSTGGRVVQMYLSPA